MLDYQQRVIDEKAELDERLERLSEFIGGEIYRDLDDAERLRLNRQRDAMNWYSRVLGQRIDAFSGGTPDGQK